MSRTDRRPILTRTVLTGRAAVFAGCAALLAGCAVLFAGCAGAPPPRPRPAPPAPEIALSSVLAAVRKAPATRALPADLTPALATTAADLGFDNEKCEAGPKADRIEPCVFGD